jgi:hypothetical protein
MFINGIIQASLPCEEKSPACRQEMYWFVLLIVPGLVQIRNPVLTMIVVVTVRVYRFSIAFARDIQPLSLTDIFQVACPAARGLNIQDESIVFKAIEAIARQAEIRNECTAIQSKQGFCTGTVRVKIERTAIGATHGCRCEPIPVEELW